MTMSGIIKKMEVKMENKQLVWPAVVVLALVILSAGISIYAITTSKADLSQVATKEDLVTLFNINRQDLTAVVSNLTQQVEQVKSTAVSTSSPASTPTTSYVVTKEEYEAQAIEDRALELANNSVFSRDFKIAVFDKLKDYGEDIEKYRHITDIKVVDSKVNDDEVTMKVIVYYYTDGDIDNKMKAYLKEFTIKVNGLDYDEGFIDAEVDDSYMADLDILKVKEL